MSVRLVVAILLVVKCECANILAVFPTPSISHQIVFRPLVLELAKRGHNVTVITTDPIPNGEKPNTLTELDVHDVSYTLWNKFLTTEKGNEKGAQMQIKYIFELLAAVFEVQIKSPQVQQFISNDKNKFDVIFIEACVRPAIAFSYLYNAPVIEISSLGPLYKTFENSGTPTHPIFYAMPTRQRVYNLTMWEKISELYTQYDSEWVFSELEKVEDTMLKKLFGRNIPTIADLRKNIQMTFLNVHPIWDFNRPVPPNTIYLGGLHQNIAKELPKDLKSYLDSSKNGVIYMSFGTNVKPSLLPAEKVKIFTNVFSKLSYDVLWKWDKHEIPGRSENVKIAKWFPQSDLLKHPNMKLFITQCGLQSTDEALTAGVPLIGVPMLGDQWFNAEQYVKHRIGIKLSIETLTEDILKKAIETIIEDDSYRLNVIKLGKIMHDQPQSPLERAVWWTEYVLRHGGAKHLQSSAANVHWTEYYGFDIALLLLGVLSVSLLIASFIVYLLLSKLKYIQVKTKID